MKTILKLVLTAFLFFCLTTTVHADESNPRQDETMEAKVVWIIEAKQVTLLDKQQTYQKLKLEITSGDHKGQTVEYENGVLPQAQSVTYKMGDQLILGASYSSDQSEPYYYIVDRVRRPALLSLVVLFVVVVTLVARKRAFGALMGLVVSFGIIFKFVLPELLKGGDPIGVSLFAAVLMIPITFYISHGFSKKTHIAIISTFLTLIVTSLLAGYFSDQSRLTGYVSEEAVFLQSMGSSTFNIYGLLIAGMILGVLGVLDDVTVSQAALVQELKTANPKLSKGQLFKQAMNVGTDHIASMVNTLVLVYVGAAMPLLMLFVNSSKPFAELVNYEMVGEEVVRSLVGSIGLVLAVPITTFLAVNWLSIKSVK